MNGSAPITEIRALNEIYAMDQQALSVLDPMTYASRLDRNDYERLLGWVKKAKEGDTNPTASAAMVDRYTFDMARRLGLVTVDDPSELQGDLKTTYLAQRREVQLEIDRQASALKRNLSPLELQAAAQTALDAEVRRTMGVTAFGAPGAFGAIPFVTRVQQLRAEGKTREEARVILQREGYAELRAP